MGRLIILEGPDGGGKTTLCEKLVAFMTKQGRSVAFRNHGTYRNETAIVHHYLESIEMASVFDFVIMDRSWLSEPIYAQVMRNGVSRLSLNDERYLSQKANQFGAQIIYCLPPLHVCMEAWSARRDLEYVDQAEKMREVWTMYRSSFSDTFQIQKRLYDWTSNQSDIFITEVLR